MNDGLSARNLTFVRGARTIIDDVPLDIEPGSFTSLIGANGAGKTALLRLLLGLLPAAGGTVTLDGRSLASLTLPRELWRAGEALHFPQGAQVLDRIRIATIPN